MKKLLASPLLSWIFPSLNTSRTNDAFLLVWRVAIGLLFLQHGITKMQNFDATAQFFASIGLTSPVLVGLAIFAEVFCSILLILGFFSRLATIPQIITMLVAFFVAHHGSIAEGELAFVYLVMFVVMLGVGPGRYSVDGMIAKWLKV